MIIRESPTKPKPQIDTNWPPRSPHEALLSSPSRRRRLQQTRERDSVSPSPKRRHVLLREELTTFSSDDDDVDEDDEETLQLQLKAIEARLKLKKLQKAKANGKPSSMQIQNENNIAKAKPPANIPAVEIPLSPKRQPLPQTSIESPKRVQLGIDKGLKASDVSLKRIGCKPAQKGKSFNERLADARSEDVARKEKEDRRRNTQSRGFGLLLNRDGSSQSFSQVSTLTSTKPKMQPDDSDPNLSNREARIQFEPRKKSNETNKQASIPATNANTDPPSHAREEHSSNNNVLERFSGFQLSKRHIAESVLDGAFKEKELYSIPRLLKEVVSPNYDPPDIETDYVVLGIITSKSAPYNHAASHNSNSNGDPDDDSSKNRSKFMVIHLTDLTWELDMFLFDTAFAAFWKLTVGTVVAILNPGIMPPKPHMRDSGKFSLKLVSSEETVLELGSAADLAFCKSVKKDGKECGQWIDRRKTEFCDFHVNLKIERTKASRMEINGMAGLSMFGGNKLRNGRGGRGRGSPTNRKSRGGLKTEGEYYDRQAHERAFVIPKQFATNRSTAALLDAEDYALGGLSKAERSRKRLAAQAKEHDLQKQLSRQGGGLGGEYMKMKSRAEDSTDKDDDHEATEAPPSAANLGLLGGRAADVKLGPSKGDRPRNAGTATQMGWSGAFKRGLPSPTRDRNPKKAILKRQIEETSPTKRARFLLEDKGIRLPGRESLPAKHMMSLDDDDDDDDGLDII